MYTLPKEPQNVFHIFLSSLKFWKEYFVGMLPAVFISVIVASIPDFLIPRVPFNPEIPLKLSDVHWPYLFIYFILVFLFSSFVVHRTYSLMYQTKMTTLNSFFIVLKKLPYLILALIFYDIAIFLGIAALLIPGIGLIVLLSMYFILIIVENENPFSGFKKSWLMVTENWWYTFVVLLILTVLIIAVTILVDYISVDLWVLAHPLGFGELALGNRIAIIIADLIFLPFCVTVLMMLYHELKLRNAVAAD